MGAVFQEVRGSFARATYGEPKPELLELMLSEHREDVAAFRQGRGLPGEPTIEDAKLLAADILANEQPWVSADYTVSMRDVPGTPHRPAMVHISIRRNDRDVIRDWRELQRIKNELLGPECEAVEIFPAESRLVDTANQYHLWALPDANNRFPFGFERGLVVGRSAGGAVQRPLADVVTQTPIKCWVVTEGGYDWSNVVGVYLNEQLADDEHQRLVRGKDKQTPGYGVGIDASELK